MKKKKQSLKKKLIIGSCRGSQLQKTQISVTAFT